MRIDKHIFTKILFSAFLLCSQIVLAAQTTATKVLVEVVDEKGNPINDVYLVENNSNYLLGTTTNGLVGFLSTSKTLSIRFSHLAFNKKLVEFEDLLKQDSVYKRVVLDSKSFGIGEVIISTEVNSLAYQNEAINVMDYEFYNNSILMLCGLGRNKQLRLASRNGYDITSMFLPKGAKAIYKDCLNNIHLIFKDSVYLIQFSDTNIFIVEPYLRKQFEETVALCEAAIDDNLIIARLDQTEQQVDFYHKPKGTRKYDFFKRIINYRDKALISGYLRAYGTYKDKGVNTGSANTVSGLFAQRRLDREYTYYKYVLSSPLFTPIYVINNQFALFDTYNGLVEWYEPNGILIQSDSIKFSAEKHWGNQLLFDEEDEEVYAFKKDGQKKFIQHVDYKTGEFGDLIQLEEHPFSENYRIKEGYIYYLYRETHQPGLVKKLYKQRL